MNIAKKLNLSFGILVLLIVVLVATQVHRTQQTRQEMQAMQQVLQLGQRVSAVVHELQKERGMSAGFLASRGANPAALNQQRQQSDEAIAQLQQVIAQLSLRSLPDYQRQQLDAFLAALSPLDDIRQQVSALSTTAPPMLGYYTGTLGYAIAYLDGTVTVTDAATIARSLHTLAQVKEAAGLERATGNIGFSSGQFTLDGLIRFTELASEQRMKLAEFARYAPPELQQSLHDIQQSNVFAKVQAMRDHAKHYYGSEQPMTVVASEWFALTTERIDELKRLEDQVNQHLLDLGKQSVTRASVAIALWLVFALLLIVLSYAVLMRVVRQGVSQPLQRIVSAIRGISTQARFSLRLPVNGQDEISELSQAVNHLLQQTDDALNEANRTVAAIAAADFSVRMRADYQGDLLSLKQGVNASAESVAFMMAELGKVMTSLYAGKFDARMDERVPESFRKQVETSLVSIESVVNAINQVMSAMAEGDFSTRVTADARGDLATMKDNVNVSVTAIADAIADIMRVVVAQAKGDLTQSIERQYSGELGDLRQAINSTIANLRELLQGVKRSVSAINEAASEIAAGNSDLSRRTEQQSASIEQSASSLTQLTVTVKQNADSARDANQLALKSRELTSFGSEKAHHAVHAMGGITTSSHRIADIISLIDGISFQTNILALNAAVEAARAGEQGRGFAVVASEVRMLAQRSANAAKEIKVLIDESVAMIDKGSLLVEETGSTIQAISQSIEQVTALIGQISAASIEQSEGLEQVNKAVVQMDDTTQQNSALVEEAAAAAKSLEEQALDLANAVATFRL